MTKLEDLIKLIDDFIATDSFLVTDQQMDSALDNWNKLFDIANSQQESIEIEELKHDNEVWADGLIMKQEKTADGKNKYTDTTLKYALEQKHEAKTIYFISNKYKFKVIPNKLKVLDNKIQWIKKIKKF